MAKRNSRGRDKYQFSNRENGADRSEGLAGKFEDATSSVTEFTGKIPSGAIYWGLGALALGAAAYGAYVYRERIVELYEEAIETFQGDETDSSSTAAESSRKSKSSSSLTQADQH